MNVYVKRTYRNFMIYHFFIWIQKKDSDIITLKYKKVKAHDESRGLLLYCRIM